MNENTALIVPPKDGPWRDIHGWFDYPDVYREIAEGFLRLSKTNGGGQLQSVPTLFEDVKVSFVEVGCWRGKSAAYMAEMVKLNVDLRHFVRIFCVDIWQGNPKHSNVGDMFPEFRDNLERLDLLQYVLPIQRKSVDAAKMFKPSSVEAIFIDASHAFEDVYDDLTNWFPKLSSTNPVFFGGHDIYWGEVRLAVERFCERFGVRYDIVGSCWKLNLEKYGVI